MVSVHGACELMYSDEPQKSMLPMVTRPISLLFVVISVVCFVWPFWREWRARRTASGQAIDR